MFNSLGWPEFAVLVVLGLLIFGPERLPHAALQLTRGLRTLRTTASAASQQLRDELGVEQWTAEMRREMDLGSDKGGRPATQAPAVPLGKAPAEGSGSVPVTADEVTPDARA